MKVNNPVEYVHTNVMTHFNRHKIGCGAHKNMTYGELMNHKKIKYITSLQLKNLDNVILREFMNYKLHKIIPLHITEDVDNIIKSINIVIKFFKKCINEPRYGLSFFNKMIFNNGCKYKRIDYETNEEQKNISNDTFYYVQNPLYSIHYILRYEKYNGMAIQNLKIDVYNHEYIYFL